MGKGGLDHVFNHPFQAQLLSVFGRVDTGHATGFQNGFFLRDDDTAATGKHEDILTAVAGKQVEHVFQIFDMTALVRADGNAVRVFLQRGIDDFGDRAVVPQVNDFDPLGLENPAHDVDGCIVTIEQTGGGHEPEMYVGLCTDFCQAGSGQLINSAQNNPRFRVWNLIGLYGTLRLRKRQLSTFSTSSSTILYHGSRMPGRMSSKATYSISDLARHFALTPRTIRFYEAEKLLSPRREKNKRVYSERDLVRLKLILRGKRLGFSLAEIKTTMQLYDTHPNESEQLKYVLRTIRAHKQELKQKQMDISNTLDEMDSVAKQVRRRLKEHSTRETTS